jgi:hypothetical protein
MPLSQSYENEKQKHNAACTECRAAAALLPRRYFFFYFFLERLIAFSEFLHITYYHESMWKRRGSGATFCASSIREKLIFKVNTGNFYSLQLIMV